MLLNECENKDAGLVKLMCMCEGRNTHTMAEDGEIKMNLEGNSLSS